MPVADYLHSRLHAADGGALRPDIVLYDEAIPEAALQQSLAALQAADLVVIVGTSMEVYPFAGLLNYANPAAQILAINQEPLHLPVDFTMLTGDAVAFFAELKI